jgi:DNA-binding protein HU-beta
MNGSDLVDEVADNLDLPRATVRMMLVELTASATRALREGESVTVPGLAKLTPVDRPARIYRNPRGGEPIRAPAKRIVKISALKALKDAVAAEEDGS